MLRSELPADERAARAYAAPFRSVESSSSRANAKTRFQISRRIVDEIPAMGTLYSSLSGIAHGEHLHVATSWDTPDTYARTIGVVTYRAVEAWSRSIHGWVGVTAAPFLNPSDIHNLLQPIPADVRAEFEDEAQGPNPVVV